MDGSSARIGQESVKSCEVFHTRSKKIRAHSGSSEGRSARGEQAAASGAALVGGFGGGGFGLRV